MVFKEKADAIWTSLVDAARARCGSERRMSLETRHSKSWAYSVKRRKKGASLEECLGLAALTGKPDWSVWGSLFPPPENAADLLRALRPSVLASLEEIPASPLLLQQLEAAYAKLDAGKGAATTAGRASVRHRLSWIDDLRLHDRHAGQRQLEREIALLLAELEFALAPDPALLCDLAFAIGIWADIQRGAGSLDAAFRVCALSLDFATLADDKWTLAQGLWKGALLLHEVDHHAFGLRLVEKAGFLFGLDGHTPHLAELLVTRGRLEWGLGRSDLARDSLREALARLSVSNQRWRVPAYECLTLIAHFEGNVAEARYFADALSVEHREQDAFQGLIQWRRAAIFFGAGDFENGREAFRAALGLLIKNGQAAGAAYAVFDLAALFLGLGDPAGAAGIAAEAMPFAAEMRRSASIVEQLENFFALSRMRPLTLNDIDAARGALAELGHAEPQRLSR